MRNSSQIFLSCFCNFAILLILQFLWIAILQFNFYGIYKVFVLFLVCRRIWAYKSGFLSEEGGTRWRRMRYRYSWYGRARRLLGHKVNRIYYLPKIPLKKINKRTPSLKIELFNWFSIVKYEYFSFFFASVSIKINNLFFQRQLLS